MEQAERIIEEVCKDVFPYLDESTRRRLAGSLAKGYGYGGQTVVEKYTHLSHTTVNKGYQEVVNELPPPEKDGKYRVRKEGGGRKPLIERIPGLVSYVKSILEETTYGDPMRVIQYTTLSLRSIARKASEEFKMTISRNVISRILDLLGYSKQQNQKMEQIGEEHPDRDKQFQHINETAKSYMAKGLPVISIDCKKKENIGNFKNNGQEYRKTGDARKVLDHDFPLPELGKVAPYGVYVLNDNTGFVNLGKSHDTAEFAVQSIRSWWYDIGQHTFPDAKKIYITADGGGSNGSRNRLFKAGLAKLAAETGLEIEVSHFPPGTSKWNKVEHRLFCYITANWAGQPLVSVETTVKLIGSTTTSTGLKVICKLDERSYPVGITVSDAEFESINITRLDPNKSWNYIITGFHS